MDEAAYRGIQEVYSLIPPVGEELFEGAIVGFTCSKNRDLVEVNDATDGVEA